MALSVDIRKALGNFHLAVQFDAGDETLALLGASGCGKSVTLKCIAGILTPDEGHIELDGVTLYDSASRINLPPQRRQVGYLFQQYALFPNMTVRQNIAAAVRDKARRQTEVAEKLRQFRLEAVADQKPGQLSGGQQQRCALARILASEPTAILLDEPFSALDSYLKYQLELELAETLSGFPGTVLWVSHDRGEVFRNCRSFRQRRIEALKGPPGGAVHQGEGHHHRGKDSGPPGHHQPQAEVGLHPGADGAVGPQQHQQQPAHHGGRQHQGQGQHHIQHALHQPGQLGDVVRRQDPQEEYRHRGDGGDPQ